MTSSLEEVLNFLEAKGNMKTANDLAKVIDSVQSDWLKQRGSQSKLTDSRTFSKPFELANV